jgi:hypothetical protein
MLPICCLIRRQRPRRRRPDRVGAAEKLVEGWPLAVTATTPSPTPSGSCSRPRRTSPAWSATSPAPARGERRRSELAEWRWNHATVTRAVEDLSAPELAGFDTEDRRLGERLSGLWEQRDTHQRWAAEHREASSRLDHLGIEIDTLDGRLPHSHSAHDRARVIEQRGVVLDRGLGIDL